MTPGKTTQEAAAREIECMARGHVAHEHIVLDKVVERIRQLPEPKTAREAIKSAHEFVEKVRKEHTILYVHCLDFAHKRLDEIDIKDPMEPFSDNKGWWPRVKKEA